MFLKLDDYKSVCDDFEFENIQADNYRETAERSAIEMISSYTRQRYDMTKEFALENEHRNPMIVQCAVNITLFLMIHRMPEAMGHERRECLYDDSIAWLKLVQSSKASPDLPTYDNEDGSVTDTNNPIRYGSEKRQTSEW